jgi:hypothetical protein
MIRKLLLAVLMLGVVTTAVADKTVYKWVDPRGQVHYTDRPPNPTEGKVLSIYQERAGIDEDGEEAGNAPAPNGAVPQPTPPEPGDASDRAAQDAVQADVSKVRAERCKEATTRYKKYIESHRLYKQEADGKRVYLSDQEITAARVQAKKDMDEFCR